MGDHTKEPLEDAEFYILYDNRIDEELFGAWNIDPAQYVAIDSEPIVTITQYDPNPAATREIRRLRLARHKQLHPDQKFAGVYNLSDDPSVPMSPEMVAKSSAFHGDFPLTKPHYNAIRDFSGSACYVVSDEWKAAIESVEPNVHQFFPHELCFSRVVKSNYYVFRCCQKSAVWRIDVSGKKSWDFSPPLTRFGEPRIAIPRLLLVGRHWVEQLQGGDLFVSSSLARKLHPLLPAETKLSAVTLLYTS
jgi:hypothetical protein